MKKTFVFIHQDLLEGTITTEDMFSVYSPLKYFEEVHSCTSIRVKLHVTNHLVSSFLGLINVVVCVQVIHVFKHIMGKFIDVEIIEK